ncbi:DUF2564 family protein [Microbacteriaceae bacterium 4G12]
MSRPFNGFEQVLMQVETAQNMVGSATVIMDPELMSHATKAVEEARLQLEKMKAVATDLDEVFITNQEHKLDQCEHQLREAMQ